MHKMNSDLFDWEDLHVFLAVARNGSARKASQALNCHYTSVTRKIAGLESRLDARLFDKSPKGYVLTELGQEIVDHAKNMESEALAISRRLYGADARITGELRVAMTTTIASYLLVDDLRDFAETYPGIELQIITDTSFADLSRGEAHVTVRVSNNPGDQLVGRKYATYFEAVYATPQYLESVEPRSSETNARWLHWLKGEAFEAYISKSEFPNIKTRQTVSDEILLLNLTKSGAGIATMPCFYCDPDKSLVRVGDAAPERSLDIWMLAHPDLTQNARVRAFIDFISAALEAKKDLLEGRCG